jgi:hypothetical protein
LYAEEKKGNIREYSRMVIEDYCQTHPGTKKSRFLWELVELSYTMECEPEDWEGAELERYISREKDPELKEALEDLDEFLFGW